MKVRTLSRLRIDEKFYLGDKVIDLPQSVVDELPPGTVEPVAEAQEKAKAKK